MRVAITHDWLTEIGGPERVLEQLLRVYPEAHVYTAFDSLPPGARGILLDVPVFTSMLQKMPLAGLNPRKLLPLLPTAMERFDLSGYDLIISNSRIAAKFVKKRPGQTHIGYMASGSRFRWDLQARHLDELSRGSRVGRRFTSLLLDYLRLKDEESTARVDRIVASSRSVARRLGASYQRPIHVIHPPVDLDFWSPIQGAKRGEYYLAFAADRSGAKGDPVIEAFSSMPQRRLVVVSPQGWEHKAPSNAGVNIEFQTIASDELLRDLMRLSRALVYAAPDELGLVMAEAQGCGLPVITLGRGTGLEIVRGLDSDAPTGLFFEERRPSSIIDAVERFEKEKFRIYSTARRESAIRFRPEAFRSQFSSLVSQAVEESGYTYGTPLMQISRETAVVCRRADEKPWGIEDALDAVEATVDVYV